MAIIFGSTGMLLRMDMAGVGAEITFTMLGVPFIKIDYKCSSVNADSIIIRFYIFHLWKLSFHIDIAKRSYHSTSMASSEHIPLSEDREFYQNLDVCLLVTSTWRFHVNSLVEQINGSWNMEISFAFISRCKIITTSVVCVWKSHPQ